MRHREAHAHRASWWRFLSLALVLALVTAACGGRGDDDDDSTGTTGGPGTTGANGEEPIIDDSACPDNGTTGVEGNTIKLGTSLPQSGPYAGFADILEGEDAYIEYMNEEKGGVTIAGEQYTVELLAKDDAYQAEDTVANVTSLVNDDQVFALFNVVGTKNNLAIRDFVSEECVPNLFAATGSPAWGNHDYPWIIGTPLVPYSLEAKAYADYVAENMPDATVAILHAADDFGRAYADTFTQATEGTGVEVVQTETYDPEAPETKSQITSLASSEADVLILGATLTACPNALGNIAAEGWEPTIFMSGTCTSKTLMLLAGAAGDNVISVAPLLDPADPNNDANEAMVLYKETVAKYSPEADVTNAIVAYGWTLGALLEETLSRSPALDRVSVMETARTLTDVSGLGLMLPDTSLNVGADDWFLGESFNLVQYDLAKGYFEPLGETQKHEGETTSVTPDDLING